MAAMVNHLNQNFHHHIITIEDPIEFVHQHQNCIIDQREIGTDTHAFAKALRSAFRQDPDVILIGELRDLETISLAMTAAETGHLVLATLHTSSAVSTLTRVIDVFPSSQQSQITTQLSFSLIGVVSQLLIPTIDNRRALAMEVMIPNVGIRNMIRENKLHGIYSAMQSGQDETGMQTMNQSLLHLVQQRRITPDMALSKSGEVNEMENLLRKALSHPVKSKHK
jgi:twitching motility protein PilT